MSWWVEGEGSFETRLADAQARMKRELPPKSVSRALAWLEEVEAAENMGCATARNPVAAHEAPAEADEY